MKNLLRVSLASALAFSCASGQAGCGGAPAKARPATSSRTKFMGIVGNPSGRHCPGKELYWVPSGETAYDLCFSRGKKPATPIQNGSLAVFSPDCNSFWVSGRFANGNLKIVNAASGKVTHTMTGSSPAWSTDSSALYFFSSDSQLMAHDVAAGNARVLLAVSDYVSCRAPGEGLVFNPVKVISESELQWEYPISSARNAGGFPGKRITFNAQSGDISKTEEGAISCGR